MASFLSPKVKLGNSQVSGKGLFAIEKIDRGEVITDYSLGTGKYISLKEADRLYETGLDHMIQIDDDLFLAATDQSETEDADYVNHSCEPNSGIKDSLKVVAMRDIDIGEEIKVDYAMIDSSKDFNLKCNCGSKNCRRIITGNDWRILELQQKYHGYFSDYLQKKIDMMRI